MKIYFAGSIRGGRDDAPLYAEIIKRLQSYGEVLTEHVGNPNLSVHGEGKAAEEIFQRDVNWIRESDIVVAEVTTVSLGVGYEIGFAEQIGKKIVCLYRPQAERRLSAMILGNTKLTVVEYESIEDIEKQCKELFA